jgi:hypothetical protein
VPVPLGVDITPQWLSAGEKAAAARRPEPVLDVGLKADSSDAVPTGRTKPAPTPAKSAAPAAGAGIVWAETGTRRPSDGRSARDAGRPPKSPGGDIDESDLIDEDGDDDDLLAEIEAGARQSKYAPKTREPRRRKRREERDHLDASFDVSRDWRDRYAEQNESESSESWYAFVGTAMMVVGAFSVVAVLLLGPYTLVLSGTFVVLGAVLVAKSRGYFDSWL